MYNPNLDPNAISRHSLASTNEWSEQSTKAPNWVCRTELFGVFFPWTIPSQVSTSYFWGFGTDDFTNVCPVSVAACNQICLTVWKWEIIDISYCPSQTARVDMGNSYCERWLLVGVLWLVDTARHSVSKLIVSFSFWLYMFDATTGLL